jgi:hypothetical protein
VLKPSSCGFNDRFSAKVSALFCPLQAARLYRQVLEHNSTLALLLLAALTKVSDLTKADFLPPRTFRSPVSLAMLFASGFRIMPRQSNRGAKTSPQELCSRYEVSS